MSLTPSPWGWCRRAEIWALAGNVDMIGVGWWSGNVHPTRSITAAPPSSWFVASMIGHSEVVTMLVGRSGLLDRTTTQVG